MLIQFCPDCNNNHQKLIMKLTEATTVKENTYNSAINFGRQWNPGAYMLKNHAQWKYYWKEHNILQYIYFTWNIFPIKLVHAIEKYNFVKPIKLF